MLFSYDACIRQFGNDYQIEKRLQSELLFKIARGIYSDRKRVSELEIIRFRYPDAVFTMDSAFYYHGLTDVIPAQFCLATRKDDTKIKDPNVRQFFHRNEQFEIGIDAVFHQNLEIRIYNRERMLIELMRNKNNLPFDYYKELVSSYRNSITDMDMESLGEYILHFPRGHHIMKMIQLEVL